MENEITIQTVKEQRDIETDELTGYLVDGIMSVPLAESNRHYQEVMAWIEAGNTPEPAYTEIEREEYLQAKYIIAMETLMDAKAQERGYDTRYTASLRVNSTVEKFKLEGQAYIAWMDSCYALGYQIFAEVQGGTRPLPTIEEFIAELPTLEW